METHILPEALVCSSRPRPSPTCEQVEDEPSVMVKLEAVDTNSPDVDIRRPNSTNDDGIGTHRVINSPPTNEMIEVVKVGSTSQINDQSWDGPTNTEDNSVCAGQDRDSSLSDEVSNDVNKEELVQQEGYIAMSENGEHCVFIPAEQVEEEIIHASATRSDGTVILTPKHGNERNIIINNNVKSKPMEHHFSSQQIKREMPPLGPITKQDPETRLHQEDNAMMMNYHHTQLVSVPEQTSQMQVHNQYNSSMPLHFSPGPRRGNQQVCTMMQQVPYHVQQTRSPYQNNPMYMQQQDHTHNGSTMSSYAHLPPVSSLRTAAVMENQPHPMHNVHQQTTVIAGGGDSGIQSSPAKNALRYNQYFMKAPSVKSISPLKTDTVIHEDGHLKQPEVQKIRPLQRMDGRPSQGLVQQVLQVFRNSKKYEMQPCEVYYELQKLYPVYTTYHGQKKKSWMSSVRHALTHPAFKSRRADDNNERESHRKGCFWSINENYDPRAPLPRRRRKVQQRKESYMNSQQQMQFMMMPMTMTNEQLMAAASQNSTAFNSMMSGNMMPGYITTQNNNGLAHTFGNNNHHQQHSTLSQPQPMMVPSFGNATNNNANMVHYGQFGSNYQNPVPANNFMEQMKAAEYPIKKGTNVATTNAQVAPQPLGLCPYIHHDTTPVEKIQVKIEPDANIMAENIQPELTAQSHDTVDKQPSQSDTCINQEQVSVQPPQGETDGEWQQVSNTDITKPTETNEMQQITQQS